MNHVIALDKLDASNLTPDESAGRKLLEVFESQFGNGGIERVVLIVPPDGDRDLFNPTTARLGRYANYPPYGVGVLASHLRKISIDVDIINLNDIMLAAARKCSSVESFDYDAIVNENISRAIETFKPQLVGVTCMFSQTHRSAVNVCKSIKTISPGTPIAIGGVHITNSILSGDTRDGLFDEFSMVNFFFFYEAEIAFADFCQIVNRKKELRDLAQVLVRHEDFSLHITNMKRPAGDQLDFAPALDLMNAGSLSDNGKIGAFHYLKPEGARLSTSLSNRGCRAQCTFCSVRNFNGMGVRGRSVQSVVDELLQMRQTHNIGHIMWLDDDLLYDHKRALSLFNEMVRQDVGITWDCSNGVIALSCTDEIISAAAASGCIGLNIGMESGNAKILKQVRKPGTVKNFLEAAEVLHKYEQIQARVFLMIGFPGETFSDILDTINVAKTMDLDWYNVTPLQPLPNTPIYDKMIQDGLVNSGSFQNVRYLGGSYGKGSKKSEKKQHIMLQDFDALISSADLNTVPSPQDMEIIWAYMNYHLNFERLTAITSRAKLGQAYKMLQYIADIVAPDDPIGHYYRAYLHARMTGRVEEIMRTKLMSLLETAPEWQRKFQELKLSISDLADPRFAESA